jgi:hypothetical protein
MPTKNLSIIQKEHAVYSKLSEILMSGENISEILEKVAMALPAAYEYPQYVSCRISFDNKEYTSRSFKETTQFKRKTLDDHSQKGSIAVFFFEEYIQSVQDKAFLKKDDLFLNQVVLLLSGAIAKKQLQEFMRSPKERKTEFRSIPLFTQILEQKKDIDSAIAQICSFLPQAWQFPDDTAARILYDGKVFTSSNFNETQWSLKQSFETYNKKKGIIEIFYLKEFPAADEGPFMHEERVLIDNLAALISGAASNEGLKTLLYENTERLKELKGLNQTSAILLENRPLEETLQMICTILPEAWQYPDYTVARITYDKHIFTTTHFEKTPWTQKQPFEAPNNKKGLIEIFYLQKFADADEGPFLKEERNLLINLANLIEGSAVKDVFYQLLRDNKERLKELKGINQTSEIIAQLKPVDETLDEICSILPKSWQYPKYTAARITYEDKVYVSKVFDDTIWFQKEHFVTLDNRKGCIEIFYLREFHDEYEGPFLKEERNLLINIARLISGYLNDFKGREIYRKKVLTDASKINPEEYRKSLIQNKRPLQQFFNKQTLDKYIYLDMMKFKVKEILFVATLYDSFIIEKESNVFERFMGIIYQYSLFSLPRITGVTSGEEALSLVENAQFDLVILMVGLDKDTPIELSKKIKERAPALPIYMLINHKSNIKYFESFVPTVETIDKLFVWSGNSEIFFAIVKSTEDEVNVENDTKIGLVRVILVIEDSAQYYSKYLQMLYSIVFEQVQQLLPEVEKNELDKICKMRSRPKILLAKNYEDAVFIFNKYKDFMLCVISDVEFERDGLLDKTAGIKFIKYVKSHILKLPIILQSSEPKNEKYAQELDVSFINKNSESLLTDLKKFLTDYLGFGEFVFRDKEGNPIAVAKSLREFETLLAEVPDETFYLHALENQYSIWLMSRGEIELAKTINPIPVGNYSYIKESRRFILETIRKFKDEKKKGKVLKFDETSILDEYNIVTYAGGSFGGKGRGLAFVNALIYNLDFPSVFESINIRAPKTVIIGTEEFELFIENNCLFSWIFDKTTSYNEIRKRFMESKLSNALLKKLEIFISQIHNPIAVRSSSLSEDSINQPFAGVFDTYVVPNNNPDPQIRLKHLVDAIKMVYASVYSDNARNYFKAITHKIEEEKMAVVLQEFVGQRYGDYYYPHISGIASSFNYYPIANMKPEEGFAVAAVGLGYYVVQGGNAYRFSPKYPRVEVYTTKTQLSSTQVKFYAIDLNKQDFDLLNDGELSSVAELEISEAEKHGVLKHCASVYNANNDRIEEGLASYGPRIVNFANILKYNYIPLAETIEIMLHTVKEALGSPVEIEYAVDLTPTLNNLPSFYLLQIKPLVGNQLNFEFDIETLDRSKILLYSTSSLGNGIIDDIHDIIYVDTANFDKLRTLEMVEEIDILNKRMIRAHKKYILIGPGRWGTSDRFLGIPVAWPQISNAKIIVETSLANFPLDSSLGSHFFHNVTSMNVGYFSVADTSIKDFITWDLLHDQNIVHRTEHFIHAEFNKPLHILMNGKKRTSVIMKT